MSLRSGPSPNRQGRRPPLPLATPVPAACRWLRVETLSSPGRSFKKASRPLPLSLDGRPVPTLPGLRRSPAHVCFSASRGRAALGIERGLRAQRGLRVSSSRTPSASLSECHVKGEQFSSPCWGPEPTAQVGLGARGKGTRPPPAGTRALPGMALVLRGRTCSCGGVRPRACTCESVCTRGGVCDCVRLFLCEPM